MKLLHYFTSSPPRKLGKFNGNGAAEEKKQSYKLKGEKQLSIFEEWRDWSGQVDNSRGRYGHRSILPKLESF